MTKTITNIFLNALDINPAEMSFTNTKSKLISKDSDVAPVHIATVGEYNGYHGGSFELTDAMFNQMVANFNKEKTPVSVYRGHADIANTSAEEPANAGWVLGLKNDGKGNLWALVEFTKALAAQIRDGAYKFSSIYMKSNDIDRVSGDEIGARLCSLAITAQPFLDNLTPIALSNNQNAFQYDIYQAASITNNNNKDSSIMKKASTKKIKLSTDNSVLDETLPEAQTAKDQMDAMQTGKVMDDTSTETDPMQLLMQAKDSIAPEMDMATFVKHLLEMAAPQEEAGEPQAEEVVETPAEEVAEMSVAPDATVAEDTAAMAQAVPAVEDKAKPQDASSKEEEAAKKKPVVEAAALSSTVSSLNLALSAAQREVVALKEEIAEYKQMALSNMIDEAIKQNKLPLAEKEVLIEIGLCNRPIFDKLMAAKQVAPSNGIVLGRVSKESNSIHSATSTMVNSKLLNMSERDRKILEGASKVKLK